MIYILVIISVINLVLLVYLFYRRNSTTNFDLPIREEFSLSRKELSHTTKELRQELSQILNTNRESIDKKVEQLRESNDSRLELIRKTVEQKLESLQKDNSEKLEKMRATVDEKLQSTLEKRLNQSFKLVSDRLEVVQRGLGEMKSLADNVGDFKRVLTNVKTRGTWGEVQLESLLEQIFIKDHYLKQVKLNEDSKEVVDFCIKLPDKSSKDGFILLPIDAKFPLEDYQRLVDAQERADNPEITKNLKGLISRITQEANSIKNKYINPPLTTDFAIMYLPIESLFAEVLRQPGLFENIQQNYRVTITGPTTISAILNSYQLGFRTLAIAQQSSAVWETLSKIKGDFSKFGLLLQKTKDKLKQASDHIDSASKTSLKIEKDLSSVQLLKEETKKN